MCGREEEDVDVFTIWFGGPFLPQWGLTRPWLVAPRRQPCPLPAAATCWGWLSAAPLGLYGCVHPGQGSGGAEGGSLYHALASVLENKSTQKPVSCLACSPQRAVPTRLEQEESQILFSMQVPHHSFFFRLSLPAQLQGGGCTRARRQLGSGESFTTANLILFAWYSQVSRPPSPPRLFLLLLLQVTSPQAPQDFLGETESLWDLSFSCQAAEQSQLSCEPALLRVVLSTLLSK